MIHYSNLYCCQREMLVTLLQIMAWESLFLKINRLVSTQKDCPMVLQILAWKSPLLLIDLLVSTQKGCLMVLQIMAWKALLLAFCPELKQI